MEIKQIFSDMSDSILVESTRAALEAINDRGLEIPQRIGALVLKNTQAETTTPITEVIFEQPIITPEKLLSTLETALITYNLLLNVTNDERAKVQSDKRPEQLKAIDHNVIKAEVEALVSDSVILTELQAEADYFSVNPEFYSPKIGFDIVIIPKGLTTNDEQAIVKNLQSKIIPINYNPYIRPEAYNDKRISKPTSKDYYIAFVPRHYNVPKGSAFDQTDWMTNQNNKTVATELKTATDAEALAQINNLQIIDELNDYDTRYDKSCFRRFDQVPVNDNVSEVYICIEHRIALIESSVNDIRPTRALIVPKI